MRESALRNALADMSSGLIIAMHIYGTTVLNYSHSSVYRLLCLRFLGKSTQRCVLIHCRVIVTWIQLSYQ